MRQNKSAQQYNDWRGILFERCKSSSVIKLLSVCGGMSSKATINGLQAELLFYKTFARIFRLSVGLDANDHCDFAGVVRGRSARFDVTNRNGFEEKKKQQLEDEVARFTGWDYYIACLEQSRFDFYKLDVNRRCYDFVALVPRMPVSIPKIECCHINNDQIAKLTKRIYNSYEHVRRTIISAVHSRCPQDVLRMFATSGRIDSRIQGSENMYFQDCIKEVDSLSATQRLELEMQVRFYLNFREILHLTATLSNLRPCYDFAGVQDGCSTRYRIVQNTSSIVPDSYLPSIRDGWTYKIVRYNYSSSLFEIFDLHDYAKYDVDASI